MRAYSNIFFIQDLHCLYLVILPKTSQEFTAADQIPAQRDQLPLVVVAEQTVVTYPDEVFRRDMHQKPPDKFHALYGQFFPYTAIFIILYPERYCFFIHAKDTAVADRYPMCIAPQVMHYSFRTSKRLPDIRNPVFPIADIQQFLIFILVPVLCGSSLIAEFPSIMQGFEARKKFPLKQSCQGLPGEKKIILFLMPVPPRVQSAAG